MSAPGSMSPTDVQQMHDEARIRFPDHRYGADAAFARLAFVEGWCAARRLTSVEVQP